MVLRLRELREAKGLKQKDIADFLGIDRSTYTKYESGSNQPSIEMLFKIADFFDVSLDFLLRRNASSNDVDLNGINPTKVEPLNKLPSLYDSTGNPVKLSDDEIQLERLRVNDALTKRIKEVSRCVFIEEFESKTEND